MVTAPVDPNAAGRWRGGPAATMEPGTGWEATGSPAAVGAPPAAGTAASPAAGTAFSPAAGTAASSARETAGTAASSAGEAAGTAALVAGGCCAWLLSLDATCAREARQVFREAASGLGLPADMIYDGATMASELAANTLYAQENIQFEGAAQLPVAGVPELWLYLRCGAGRWELACKVFDSLAGWKCGSPPGPGVTRAHAGGGRGLQIVAGLSGGRWGHHLSRSRLGGWKVPGKAVWFAQPVRAGCIPARLQRARPQPCQVSRRLEVMLAARGLGANLLRAGEAGAGISVLSVRRGLTVWCLPNTIMWRTGSGVYEQRAPTELEDTAERIVSLCEQLDSGQASGRPSPSAALAGGPRGGPGMSVSGPPG
jgi:hypothetical protein